MITINESSSVEVPQPPTYWKVPSPLSGTPVHQGAEARLYRATLYSSRDCIVKERFVKSYRHPTLDTNLSMQRMRAEVRLLLHCRRLGLDVPPVLQVDVPSRRLWLGFIGPDALTLHDWFRRLAEQLQSGHDRKQFVGRRLQRLVDVIGRLLARLHANHVVHGDLTMSNILVRKSTEAEELGSADPRVALIDFGLSSNISHSTLQRLPEEKAVDLYVFERALGSALDQTFLSSLAPEFEQFSSPENLIYSILNSYCLHYPSQATQLRFEKEDDIQSEMSSATLYSLQAEAKANLTKLDEVRLRGRKRLMIG